MAVTGIRLWEIPERLTEPMLHAILSNLSDVEEELAIPQSLPIVEGVRNLMVTAGS